MKKTISLLLAAVFTLTVAATAYTLGRAEMRVFSARIAPIGSPAADGPQLVLATGNHAMGSLIGSMGDITGGGEEQYIPVFEGGAFGASDGSEVVHDINGQEALAAKPFCIFAQNGDFKEVSMKLELSGDLSAAKAIHVGVTAKYYDSTTDMYSRGIGTFCDFDVDGVSNVVDLGQLMLGDAVEVQLSAFVLLDEYEGYSGGDIAITAVFSGVPF